MVLPFSLAMTPKELTDHPGHPCAYMACHFSYQDTGLSSIPDALPPNSILILDDSTPPAHHDMPQIARQLCTLAEKLETRGILLDFQRPDIDAAGVLIRQLTEDAPCPVAVSALYGKGFTCPVFLPPPPLHRPLEVYLKPWQNRPIWLEAALSRGKFLITPQGSRFYDGDTPSSQDVFFTDDTLRCCYQIHPAQEQAEIYLWRTPEQLAQLLDQAAALGVVQAVGLFQELGQYFPINKNSEE